MRKRAVLLLLTIGALVVALLIPANAQATETPGSNDDSCHPSGSSSGSGSDSSSSDDDGCTTTTEVFDADRVVTYVCPPGFEGPDADNQCTKTERDYFPATPVHEYFCPPGYTGPDSANKCSKEVTTVDTKHVDESTEYVCLDGFTLGSDPAGEPACLSELLTELIEVPGEIKTTKVCPIDFVGPDADGNCITLTKATKPASTRTELLCPAGYTGPNDHDECTIEEHVTEHKGLVIEHIQVCPEKYTLSSDHCIRDTVAAVRWTCLDNFTLDESVFPPICRGTDERPATPEQFCEHDQEGPIPLPGTGAICRETISPITETTTACPAGYDGPDSMNLCSRTVTVTKTVPAVSVDIHFCEPGYLGPDENGECLKLSPETQPAEIVEQIVCPPGAIGPQPDGKCYEVATFKVEVPAIDRPVFTCPAGYDGPDAKWNCSKSITETVVVNAERRIVGYECPGDAHGPTADNLCFRDTVTTEHAIEEVTYECPDDSIGPDANNQCTRTIVIKDPCTIKFYDYPNGHSKLFSKSKDGTYNLTGALAHYDDDVESVRVPHDCSVSVSGDYDGHGWCYTFGPGLHNLPDDEMSWFSIPGTGCNSDPAPDCKIRFYDYRNGKTKLFSEERIGTWNLDGPLHKYNNDVESVHVPDGCSVAVARSYNGSGWCYDLGPGLHNLPDDEMSWFSTERGCH